VALKNRIVMAPFDAQPRRPISHAQRIDGAVITPNAQAPG